MMCRRNANVEICREKETDFGDFNDGIIASEPLDRDPSSLLPSGKAKEKLP